MSGREYGDSVVKLQSVIRPFSTVGCEATVIRTNTSTLPKKTYCTYRVQRKFSTGPFVLDCEKGELVKKSSSVL